MPIYTVGTASDLASGLPPPANIAFLIIFRGSKSIQRYSKTLSKSSWEDVKYYVLGIVLGPFCWNNTDIFLLYTQNIEAKKLVKNLSESQDFDKFA